MAGPRLAIVIPALNESASVGAVVAQAARWGTAVVVDDGSHDGTGDVAQAAGASVVRHERNRGYDGALDSGFARAASLGCDWIVTMDADGQHNPDLLQRFIAELESGADIVIGVRDRRQRLAEHVFAWVGKRLWGIQDPLCGMKAYRREIYDALGHFDSYGSIGTELALFAVTRGCKLTQIPVLTRDRDGVPRFGRVLRGNWLIFRALALAFSPGRRRQWRRADLKSMRLS